jgi:uncharacterized protein DUF6939
MAGTYQFLSRADAARLIASDYLSETLLVDSFDGAPSNMAVYRAFNPFTLWLDQPLPVPGRSATSMSVEAIWQGLKIVDGDTDEAMFTKAPYKRPTDAARRAMPDYRYDESLFAYGERRLDIITARFLIYAVSYLHLLDRVVEAGLIADIRAFAARGGRVIFFDWDSNGDILHRHRSYSHSALLAAWFAGRLAEHLFGPARKSLGAQDFSLFEAEAEKRLARYTAAP